MMKWMRLLDHFGDKCVCVRGGMSDKQKQQSVDRFQEDNSCHGFCRTN